MVWERACTSPPHSREGRRCLSPSQILAPTAAKAGSGRALLGAAPKNTERRRAEGLGQLDRKTFIPIGPRYPSTIDQPHEHIYIILRLALLFYAYCYLPDLQTKMSQFSPCGFQWSPLWLASLAAFVVQLVLSSPYSSSSTYQRPAVGGKRPGFMERTLILLDVNTRSPIRVLNDNFLSLQLDPSIIKDGWLDFLRYFFHTPFSYHVCTKRTFGGFKISLRTKPRCVHSTPPPLTHTHTHS